VDFTEGSSFLLLDGSGKQHLWAILSDPTQSNSEIVIANFTTFRGTGYEDTSCIVESGEHPFIKNRSYVRYRSSKIIHISKLDLWFSTGELIPKERLSPGLLAKIRAGAKENVFLPLNAEQILSMQNLI